MARRNPFNDESDSKTQEANDRLAEKVRERAEAPDDSSTTRVEVREHDEDDGEPRGPETPQQRNERLERRRDRYRQNVERATAAEQRAQELEQRVQRMEMERVADEAARRYAPPPQPQTPQADPLDREIEVTQMALENVRQEYRRVATERQLTAVEVDAYNKKAEDLQRQVLKLEIRKESAPRGALAAVSPQAVQQAAREEMLRFQYPDIMGDQIASEQARLNAVRLMRDEGKRTADPDIIRRAVDMTREQLGMPGAQRRSGSSQQSAGFKSKFGGAAPGASGGGNGTINVDMTPDDKRMARAMWPQMKEAEAYAHWAKTVGAKRAREGA